MDTASAEASGLTHGVETGERGTVFFKGLAAEVGLDTAKAFAGEDKFADGDEGLGFGIEDGLEFTHADFVATVASEGLDTAELFVVEVFGAASNFVVVSLDFIFQGGEVGLVPVEVTLIHFVDELFEGGSRDDVIGAVAKEVVYEVVIAEEEVLKEHGLALLYEGGHVAATGDGEFFEGNFLVHDLPGVLTGLLADGGDHVSGIGVGDDGVWIADALAVGIDPKG